MLPLKVGTWNLNGLRARTAQLLAWIDEEKPDVICLQEIRVTQEQIPMDLVDLPGYHSYWHGGPKGYSGVALHVADRLGVPKFTVPTFDLESRIVQATVGDLTLISVYVPNGGKDFQAKMAFLETLVGHLRSLSGKVILCGDLNVARAAIDVHPKERKKAAIGQLPVERELFESGLLGHGLVDVQRSLYPDDETIFTWWAPWRELRQKNVGWRIDYILASSTLAATSCVSQRLVGTSDHAPVVAVFG